MYGNEGTLRIMTPILFRPAGSVAADFIPFYWKGDYHLFYLRDYRDPQRHGEGTPWWHVVTRDFVHFDDWGEALGRGTKDEQDLYVFTGSVFEADGAFHIFYTGHNPHLRKAGKPEQAVLHATSPDLKTWAKDRSFAFFAPVEKGYEPHDWRDPFVFRDERTGQFGMLLAARKSSGPSRNRGCTAFATSPDLKNWTVQEPFWAPDQYYTHECPDLFKVGDQWYLVYSTFSDRFLTHYRVGRSPGGPWTAPANDSFDGRAYYAAKTAGDERKRFVFGWLPTRAEEKDDGAWQWGGDLVVHDVRRHEDGNLVVRMPKTVRAQFTKRHPLVPLPVLGKWRTGEDRFSAAAVGRCSMLSLGPLPEECLVEAMVSYRKAGAKFGVLLRADEAFDQYYQIRFEPAAQRMVTDRWPRPGDQPFMLERPLYMKAGRPIRLRILVSGTCLVVYADDEVALSCRMYENRKGSLGLFVSDGIAWFSDVRVSMRAS